MTHFFNSKEPAYSMLYAKSRAGKSWLTNKIIRDVCSVSGGKGKPFIPMTGRETK